ncbi:MAG: hypothetical protein J2P49_03275 [Methylocapsa sp.]|nr:hypothetical protein [Methylocapsa sp.]
MKPRWQAARPSARQASVFPAPAVDLAIPVFGYQNHISIDRGFGFIRKWAATDAAAYESALLREGLLDKSNTASDVFADTAYRSAANEAFMEKNGFVNHVHRKNPKGRLMPEAGRLANAAKSKVRSHPARLRLREGSDGPVHPHDRDRPRQGENRHGEPRL